MSLSTAAVILILIPPQLAGQPPERQPSLSLPFPSRSFTPVVSLVLAHMSSHLPLAGGSFGFCDFSISPISSSNARDTFSP